MELCSVVSDSVTLWTITHHSRLSVGFPRQKYGNGYPFPSPGDLPDPGAELESPMAPALAGGFFTTEPPRKPPKWYKFSLIFLIQLRTYEIFLWLWPWSAVWHLSTALGIVDKSKDWLLTQKHLVWIPALPLYSLRTVDSLNFKSLSFLHL